jgi:hypothetical protein
MRYALPLAALAALTVTREAHADTPADARLHRAAAYAVPVALLASAQEVPAPGDVSKSLWLAGMSTLSLPFWTSNGDASSWLGLSAFLLGSGTVFGSGFCRGTCRTAILASGLLGYSGLAVADVRTFAFPRASDDAPAALGPYERRWYGWRPLIGYGSLLGGLWLATIDEAGFAGGGLAIASVGLESVPLSHFGVGRYAHGWISFGGTLAAAASGALAACANGCDSMYAHGTRAVFEPGRALIGATAGVASWALIDAAFLSYRDEPTAARPGLSVEPYLATSPTTGRPRAGASFAF